MTTQIHQTQQHLLAEERQKNIERGDTHAGHHMDLMGYFTRLQVTNQMMVELLLRDEVVPHQDVAAALLLEQRGRLENPEAFWVAHQHGPHNLIEILDDGDQG